MANRVQTIQNGELVLDSLLETQKATGEFANNKYLVENICSIVNTLLLYYSKSLSKDQFLGMTIQFADHYYKIDLSKEDRISVEKYAIFRSAENINN